MHVYAPGMRRIGLSLHLEGGGTERGGATPLKTQFSITLRAHPWSSPRPGRYRAEQLRQ